MTRPARLDCQVDDLTHGARSKGTWDSDMESRTDGESLDSNWKKWNYHDRMILRRVIAVIAIEAVFFVALGAVVLSPARDLVSPWEHGVLVVLLICVASVLTVRFQRILRDQILRDLDARAKWAMAMHGALEQRGLDLEQEYVSARRAPDPNDDSKVDYATRTELTLEGRRNESLADSLDLCIGAIVFLAFCSVTYLVYLLIMVKL